MYPPGALRFEELGGEAVTKGPTHRLQTLAVALGQQKYSDQDNQPQEKLADEQYDQHDERAGHWLLRPILRVHGDRMRQSDSLLGDGYLPTSVVQGYALGVLPRLFSITEISGRWGGLGGACRGHRALGL